jgi:hypothetical protein
MLFLDILVQYQYSMVSPFNFDFNIFGFPHKLWIISTTNVMYTRLQNYTNLMIDKHELQTFEVVVVVLLLVLLSFDVLVPTSAHPILFSNKWFV